MPPQPHTKTYNIRHFNGYRPFRVVVHDQRMCLDVFHSHPRHAYKVTSAFFDTVDVGTTTAANGNSVLCLLARLRPPSVSANATLPRYLYISSHAVFYFSTFAPITTFVGPQTATDDVHEPYAKDERGNLYLLGEDVVITPNELTERHIPNYANPYRFYFEASRITADEGYSPPGWSILTVHFRNIHHYYIDHSKYTLKYAPRPRKEYARVARELRMRNAMYLTFVHVPGDDQPRRQKLTRSDFEDLMDEWGRWHGMQALIEKETLYD